MTDSIAGNRVRFVARVLFLPVVCVFAMLVLTHVVGPLLKASAQGMTPTSEETTSSTQTPNPSPSPEPTGRAIQFLNPSNYSSPKIVSIKPDEDGFYHLVAWVSQPQASDLVEFEAVPTDQNGNPTGNPITIGTAVAAYDPPTSPPDTFECYWGLGNDVPNGNYILRAKLYSTGPAPATTSCGTGTTPSPSSSPGAPTPTPAPAPVTTDEEQVVVDRTAETVEITYPRNGDQIGVYDPDDPDPADTQGDDGPRRDGFTVDVVTSDGVDGVVLWYSVSNRGNEPEWTRCREQVTVTYPNRTRRIGCTFPGEPPTVNAIAVVAQDEVPGTPPPPSCLSPTLTPVTCSPGPSPSPMDVNESGDAHRVAGAYSADPHSVNLTHLEGDNAANAQSCHEMIATVLDQQLRPVWRANVDLHGTGPGDGLRFAETDRTDPFKPPEGGSHTETEFAWDCDAGESTSDERQAEHDRPGEQGGEPIPDRKHIESVPGTTANEAAQQQGTDIQGEFVFALRSPRTGATTVEAWADEDDDDENDPDGTGTNSPADPQDTETVNWLQATPTPPPSTTPSGTPTATPTGSPTGSPTGTPTATPTATPTSSPEGPTLNCEPETSTNPVRSAHRITCQVTLPSSSSPSPTASPSPSPSPTASPSRAGFRVHAEATGANDPDQGNTPTTPDFTECVTNSEGVCTFTHGPGGTGSTNNTGPTLYRAWIDDGNDTQVEADQTEGRDEFQNAGGKEPDNTDVVEKNWQVAPLECDPEQDANPTGTAHTFTCRAATPGGTPNTNVQIDVEASGANDPDGTESYDTPDWECFTDNNGQCTFTHGPGGTGSTNAEGVTRYRAWVDTDTSNAVTEADRFEGRNERNAAEQGQVAEPDETDLVEKTWTRNPTALTIEPESDAASVGSCNAFTITVRGDNNLPVSGVFVDVEQRHERAGNQTNNDEPRVAFCTPRATDGPNPSGVDQTQGDLDPPDENPDNPGTSGGETLTATDSQGRVTIGVSVEPANGSDGTGNVAVTAFFETDDDNDPEAGEPQDSATKTWVLREARTIACDPDTATNPVNTQHAVTCTVRDRFGDPVEGEGVTFTETGPGDFTSRGTRTNANGQVVAVTTSGEAGVQSITGTLDDDLEGGEPGETDDCDRPAGTPTGAPQGACSDTVSKTWVVATTSPAQFERDVTLEAQKNQLVFNKNVTLSGAVEADENAPDACSQFVEVSILRDVVGGPDDFEVFATEQTDADGVFSHSFRADRSANYVAEVEELTQCADATSDAEPVLVKVKVGLRLSDSSVSRGSRVRLTVTTRPCPATARDRVLLFKAIDGEFGKVGGKRTNDRCVKSFSRRVFDDSLFQARWPKQSPEFLAGRSRSKVVRVQNQRR